MSATPKGHRKMKSLLKQLVSVPKRDVDKAEKKAKRKKRR